jgi:hypothetical protein
MVVGFFFAAVVGALVPNHRAPLGQGRGGRGREARRACGVNLGFSNHLDGVDRLNRVRTFGRAQKDKHSST